jgi:hypothetical protein
MPCVALGWPRRARAWAGFNFNTNDCRRGDGERGGSMTATATAPAPQHMRALAQANRVRHARAELKRRVADAELTAAEVVLTCPWEADSMSIADLLTSQHRWGKERCRRFLASVPMLETKTIGSMTERQRRALAARLEGDAATIDAPFALWGGR